MHTIRSILTWFPLRICHPTSSVVVRTCTCVLRAPCVHVHGRLLEMCTKEGGDLYHSYCYKEKRNVVELLEVHVHNCRLA
jgi:hypothetical protein